MPHDGRGRPRERSTHKRKDLRTIPQPILRDPTQPDGRERGGLRTCERCARTVTLTRNAASIGAGVCERRQGDLRLVTVGLHLGLRLDLGDLGAESRSCLVLPEPDSVRLEPLDAVVDEQVEQIGDGVLEGFILRGLRRRRDLVVDVHVHRLRLGRALVLVGEEPRAALEVPVGVKQGGVQASLLLLARGELVVVPLQPAVDARHRLPPVRSMRLVSRAGRRRRRYESAHGYCSHRRR
jgi:hypothetical protein